MSGGGGGSNIYQYADPGGADAGAISGIGQLQGAGNQVSGLYGGALGGLSGLTQGTNYNSQQGVDAGNAITQSAQNANLPGYANQALATGFNQNNGLYNQELGNVNDQTNAALAQRGIASSPYGAGVLGQTDSNFNNNWQQQQLQNQSTAAGTADSLLGQYGSSLGTGAQVSQGAADNSLSSLSSLISSGNSSQSLQQQAIQDYLSYLSGGTAAGSAQATANNQSNQLESSGLSGLGSLFGNIATKPLSGTLLGGLI